MSKYGISGLRSFISKFSKLDGAEKESVYETGSRKILLLFSAALVAIMVFFISFGFIFGFLSWTSLRESFFTEIWFLLAGIGVLVMYRAGVSTFTIRGVLTTFLPMLQMLQLEGLYASSLLQAQRPAMRLAAALLFQNVIALIMGLWIAAPSYAFVWMGSFIFAIPVGTRLAIIMSYADTTMEETIILWRIVTATLVYVFGVAMFLYIIHVYVSALLKEADSSREAREDFLNRISHDMRTPLSGIIGYAELLLQGKDSLSSSQRDIGQSLHACAKTALTLVDEVLDWSHVRSGAIELRKEPFRLKQLVQEVESIMTGLMRNKSIDFKVEAQNTFEGGLLGDESRVKQVVLGLLGNARKFTPPNGKIVCTFSSRTLPSGREEVTCTVHDTGIGFTGSADVLFEPRVQQMKLEGGLGLGLYIAKDLIHQMGGSIRASSPGKGKGATFSFTLQFCHSSKSTDDLRGQALSLAASEVLPTYIEDDTEDDVLKSDGAPVLRVLCVDDSPMLLNVIERMVLQLNTDERKLELVTCENGVSACALIEEGFSTKNPYAVVITDIHMPGGIDGAEVVALVRHKEKMRGFPPTRMVGLSASTDAATVSLASHFDFFVRKPISREKLQSAIFGQ